MAENKKQGMRWLKLASEQDNKDAQALLGQLRQAHLRDARSERRQAEQARNLRAELDKAKVTEDALKRRLEQSREREKRFATERKTLEKARTRDARAAEKMRREQARLKAELETLRASLAEAERSRMQVEVAKDEVVKETVQVADTIQATPDEAVVSGKVVEIFPDGVLLADVSRQVQGRSEPFPEGFVVFMNLAATGGLSEGQEVAFPAEPAIPYRYRYENGATGRIRAFRAIGE